MTGAVISAMLGSRAGRLLALVTAVVVALWVANGWIRAQARAEVLRELEIEDVETNAAVDRSLLSFRECIVSGGLWRFGAGQCVSPDEVDRAEPDRGAGPDA